MRIYDPSAGSGTLLMNLASRIGVDKATVYSQDISQKSSNLLRLNLILNGLQHSIHNIVEGNTILRNRHPEKMDYIVSNPPSSWTFQSGVTKWRPCQKPVSVSLQECLKLQKIKRIRWQFMNYLFSISSIL